jgi:hypothetical protein
MDIFSFLPIVIFIYAIATIFNPGNKSPNKRRQGPQQGSGRSPSQFPAPKTWREKIEELERELFPKEEDQRQQTRRTPPFETHPSSEGYGTEGYAGIEGSSGVEGSTGVEGSWGLEGTSGTEGSLRNEGTYVSEGNLDTKEYPTSKGTPRRTEPLTSSPEVGQSSKPTLQENPSTFPIITKNPLVQGVIWAEVLGKPRARDGWSYGRRR